MTICQEGPDRDHEEEAHPPSAESGLELVAGQAPRWYTTECIPQNRHNEAVPSTSYD